MPPKRKRSPTHIPDNDAASQSEQGDPKSWPKSIVQVFDTFKAMNVLFAFLEARASSTSLSFASLKSSLDGSKKPDGEGVKIEDIASIGGISPEMVRCRRDDDGEIMIDFGPAKGKKKADLMKEREKPPPKTMQVKAIQQVILRREKAFGKAVAQFLKKCEQKKLDVIQEIENGTIANLPDPLPSSNDTSIPQTAATERPQIKHLLNQIQNAPFYENQMVPAGWKSYPERTASWGQLKVHISPVIREALSQSRNITSLYSHQAESINALCSGKNVIVTTSTASGKSLIYQIPVLEALLEDKDSKAMYIFPTKALAQDQLRSLQDIISVCTGLEDTMISTFDGDTPKDQRRYIRDTANIIFTNPDMLHHSVLPNSYQWRQFLQNLKYVVVDELHIYNGLFGSNVALVMRRLRRLCSIHGNDDVRFVSCSATIGNADEHMRNIFGLDEVHLVDVDGAPCGQKEFVLWNPPMLNENEPKLGRRSSIQEAALVLEYLISHEVRTIVFCKVRRTCEHLMKQIRTNFQQSSKSDLLRRVMSYRGGYTPQDRRRIEKQMFSGELLAVIATNALELGVDIGSLDAVLMLGIPWSISAMWQQSGRAGRRNNDSLALLIAAENPMDQHFMRQPDELFNKGMQDIAVDIDSPLILEGHLQCAANEQPIDLTRDCDYFGEEARNICKDHLVRGHDERYRCHPKFLPNPSSMVNIRGGAEDMYTVVDTTNGKSLVLEEIEASRASFEIYEGAIFIHQGITYLVDQCNVDQHFAKVRRVHVDWTTRQRDYTDVDATETLRTRIMAEGQRLFYGKLKVSTHVFGYYKLDKRNQILDTVDVYMDPIIRTTNGIWVDVPINALRALGELELDMNASVHAAAHSLLSLIPTFAYSSAGDVRTECKSPLAARHRPARISLYEPEACGTTGKAYNVFERLLHASYENISACDCEEGCPRCVHLSQCSEQNLLVSKQGAIIILKEILGIH
ncbi:unnamed protein product [Umbelopsis ramanniana]